MGVSNGFQRNGFLGLLCRKFHSREKGLRPQEYCWFGGGFGCVKLTGAREGIAADGGRNDDQCTCMVGFAMPE